MLFNRNCNCMPRHNMGGCGCQQPAMEQCIVEPMINKCVEREFFHQVPQV